VLAFAYLGGISTVGGAVMAGTLFAEGIGIVVTEQWFNLDVQEYTAYVAGFFLILTAVYNNEGIDGFQRSQFYRLVERLRRNPEPPAEAPEMLEAGA
jgi:branched-chain amino acid transport system permease protein